MALVYGKTGAWQLTRSPNREQVAALDTEFSGAQAVARKFLILVSWERGLREVRGKNAVGTRANRAPIFLPTDADGNTAPVSPVPAINHGTPSQPKTRDAGVDQPASRRERDALRDVAVLPILAETSSEPPSAVQGLRRDPAERVERHRRRSQRRR